MVKELELGRKLVHIFGYLLVFFLGWALYANYGFTSVRYALLALLIAMLLGDYLTTELGLKIPIYSHCQRTSEVNRGIHSATFGILGSLLALEFFEIKIAVAAILMMVISDQAAALVGKSVKFRIIFKKKTYSGAIIALILNFIIAFLILDKIWVIFGIVLTATAVEVLVEKLDDNLMVPLIAGLAGHLLNLI